MKARLWVYPWDILDEGPGAAMERIAEAGFDEISVSMLYHGGTLLLPHNPRRKVYFTEDGATYFVPDRRRYRGQALQPIASRLTEDGDPLARICEAAAAHGLGTVAWLVCLHNDRMGLEHPDATVENAFGDRYPYALCVANHHVGTFFETLVADLSSRYALAGIDLESLYHQGFPHQWSHTLEGTRRSALADDLLSLCFCEACTAAAADALDTAALRRSVRTLLERELTNPSPPDAPAATALTPQQLDALIPEASAYLAARTQAVTSLLERVRAASQAPVHGLIGSGLSGREHWVGIDVAAWAARCDSVTVNCYQPRTHVTVEDEIAQARRQVGESSLYIGLRGVWPQVETASQLRQRIGAAAAVKADGVSIYNYGLMPRHHLDWIKDTLAEV